MADQILGPSTTVGLKLVMGGFEFTVTGTDGVKFIFMPSPTTNAAIREIESALIELRGAMSGATHVPDGVHEFPDQKA
jgi:hypothetical protein